MDSAIGRPSARLAPFVRDYVGYHYEGIGTGTHLGMPSRHVTVVISLDRPTQMLRMPEPRQAPADFAALAGGLHTRAAVIGFQDSMCGVQLALTPAGARSLLGLPAGALGPTVVDLDTLLGPAATELVERMRAAVTWPDRFAVLDEVLSRGIGRRSGAAPELDHAWQRLTRGDGAVRIDDLAREVGWSRRHFSERFAAEYGLTPKEAARVMRFERSKLLLQRPGRPTLAAVATMSGYYDQAHMARDWNRFLGCPPSAWLAAEELLFVQADEPVAARG
jgi:AraC-like DNA-binding protein